MASDTLSLKEAAIKMNEFLKSKVPPNAKEFASISKWKRGDDVAEDDQDKITAYLARVWGRARCTALANKKTSREWVEGMLLPEGRLIGHAGPNAPLQAALKKRWAALADDEHMDLQLQTLVVHLLVLHIGIAIGADADHADDLYDIAPPEDFIADEGDNKLWCLGFGLCLGGDVSWAQRLEDFIEEVREELADRLPDAPSPSADNPVQARADAAEADDQVRDWRGLVHQWSLATAYQPLDRHWKLTPEEAKEIHTELQNGNNGTGLREKLIQWAKDVWADINLSVPRSGSMRALMAEMARALGHDSEKHKKSWTHKTLLDRLDDPTSDTASEATVALYHYMAVLMLETYLFRRLGSSGDQVDRATLWFEALGDDYLQYIATRDLAESAEMFDKGKQYIKDGRMLIKKNVIPAETEDEEFRAYKRRKLGLEDGDDERLEPIMASMVSLVRQAVKEAKEESRQEALELVEGVAKALRTMKRGWAQ